jgi:hypothetical protein
MSDMTQNNGTMLHSAPVASVKTGAFPAGQNDMYSHIFAQISTMAARYGAEVTHAAESGAKTAMTYSRMQ